MMEKLIVNQKKMNHHYVLLKSANVVIQIISNAIMENASRNDGAAIMILIAVTKAMKSIVRCEIVRNLSLGDLFL